MLLKSVFIVLGIGLLATLGLDYILGIKTWQARLSALIVSISLTVAGMWYFAEYGENPEDSAACWMFDKNTSCRAKIARSENPTPELSQPPKSVVEVQPLPKRPTIKKAEQEYVSFDGWWPTGTPLPDASLKQSANILWQWSEQRKGSCQPLRAFAELYPNDTRVELARMRLSRISVKSERKRRIVSERGPLRFVEGSSGPEIQGEAAICEGLYQADYNSSAGAGCSGVAAAHRLILGPTELRSAQASAIPSSCKCSKQWLTGDIECSVKVEKTCVFETNYLYNLERCT